MKFGLIGDGAIAQKHRHAISKVGELKKIYDPKYMNNMPDNKMEEPSPMEPHQPTENQNSSDMESEKKEEDEKIIVEADSEAIEAALKKRTDEEDDKSMIAADEQTIVDRVLSQKKKGKWSRH